MSLAKLLQLASPTLPVGAYSYSGGLEAAIEAGVVKRCRDSAERWIGDVLEFSVARMEAPMLFAAIRLLRRTCKEWNELFLASRETAELRAETVQMGYSLNRLLKDLGAGEVPVEEPSFPAAFAYAAAHWKIEPEAALQAYLWAWLENQVMAAVKAVPLGQTDGQRILLRLGDRISRRSPGKSCDERRRDRQFRAGPRDALRAARDAVFAAVPLMTLARRHRRAGRLRQDGAHAGAVQAAARPLQHRGGHQRHLHRGGRAVPGAQRGARARAHHRRGDRRLPAHRDPRGRLDQPGGGGAAEPPLRRAST